MTDLINRLRWEYIIPLKEYLSDNSLIHFAVFPWEEGCVLYRLDAEENGAEKSQFRHVQIGKRASESLPSDIFLSQEEADQIEKSPDILTNSLAEERESMNQFPSWFHQNTNSALLHEQLKQEFAGDRGEDMLSPHVLSEIDHLASSFQEENVNALPSIMEKYAQVLSQWEKILPSPLHGRYRVTLADSERIIGPDDTKIFIVYLFGGLLGHLREDLRALGYELSHFSLREPDLILSLRNKRESITIDWAKECSNAILTKVREKGYVKALSLTGFFQKFVQRYPHIAGVHCLGGTLNNLLTTLYASCSMGIVKEGIVNREWKASRIVNEYEKVIHELPMPFNDSILIGTPVETLYSFTVNTLAWLEMNKDYDHSRQISQIFLGLMEKRFKHEQNSKINKRDYNVLLAASLYKYMQMTKQENDAAYPHTAAIAKKIRVPYRLMSRVYRPRFRLAEMKGFFDFVSRGYSHRLMLSSIGFSIAFILFLIFVVNK